MIQFRTISAYMEARERLRRRRYWGGSQVNRESDQLMVFTTERDARLDSRANLSWLMDQARAVGAKIVIAKPAIMQAVGHRDALTPRRFFGDDLFEELETYSDTHDRSSWWMPKDTDHQTSDFGSQTVTLRTFGSGGWVTPEDQGFYDVESGQKITNRHEQITRLWSLGFASRRGRPVHVAQERWAGSRGELEAITEMARRFWDRYHVSEVARKTVAAYRGINKYVAWPGSW